MRTVIPVVISIVVIVVCATPAEVAAQERAPIIDMHLMQERGVADDAFARKNGSFVGIVRVHGELWRAVCAAPVTAGQDVVVEDREGLTLHVRPTVEGHADQRPTQE